MTKKQKKMLSRILISAVLFLLLYTVPAQGVVRLLLYLIPYAVIGWDVLWRAVKNIRNGQVFDENFLMSIATIGAFGCGEYPEAVAVMLFYQVGELFQSVAVGRSRQSIAALMDIRPDYANMERDGQLVQVDPDEVAVGDTIVIKAGERVPLDGIVTQGNSALDTAALTGESLPRSIRVGDDIISGCVNLTGLLRVTVNESRKLLTMHAVEQAKEIAQQEEYVNDRVLVIFLPDCHESLAGIVAGRIREAYYRPTLVVTRSEHGAKGSGRSIEGYSMYEELCKCEEYLTQFGGHPMAAGFSLKEADIDAFRRKLNAVCTLTEEELRPKVVIDVPMPISYITERLVNQLGCLEPFGKGNEKPVFADRNLVIERLRICGKEGRVFQMKVRNAAGVSMDAVYFGDVEDLLLPLTEKYGKVVAQDTLAGRCVHEAALHFTYYPEMDHYYETPRIKLRLTGVSV